MDTPVKRAKSTALGKRCNRVAAILNTENDISTKKGA